MTEKVPAKENLLSTELIIRSQTAPEELQYILGELIPRYKKYQEYGYAPEIPQIESFLLAAKNGLLEENIQGMTKEFNETEYDSDIYKVGLDFLEKNARSIWQGSLKIMKGLKKEWGFVVYPNYEARLTAYGTGGDYYPSFSAFDGQPRPQPGSTEEGNGNAIILMRVKDDEFIRPNPEHTLIHEAVHLGIEEIIVRKYSLFHWEKEMLVDLICLYKFGKLLPGYKVRKKDEKEGIVLGKFVTEETISNLPQAVQAYIEAHPRD